MIHRKRYTWDHYKHHGNIPIKQTYARIYIESKQKFIIVSKDNIKRQIPWWKPKTWESPLETLCREVWEETSINLRYVWKIEKSELFWYYYIEDGWVDYLQLRYFIKIDDLNEDSLKSNEIDKDDSINYVKLVSVKDIRKVMPYLRDSWELNYFLNGKHFL